MFFASSWYHVFFLCLWRVCGATMLECMLPEAGAGRIYTGTRWNSLDVSCKFQQQLHCHSSTYTPSVSSLRIKLYCDAPLHLLPGVCCLNCKALSNFPACQKTVLRELPEDASIPGQQQGGVRPMPEFSPSPGGVKLVLSFQLLHTRRQTRGSRRN